MNIPGDIMTIAETTYQPKASRPNLWLPAGDPWQSLCNETACKCKDFSRDTEGKVGLGLCHDLLAKRLGWKYASNLSGKPGKIGFRVWVLRLHFKDN